MPNYRDNMKAIITKYHGPTNYKGSRISATAEPKHRVTVSWDHSVDSYANHRRAAEALIKKMGWDQNRFGRSLVGGGMPGCAMAWVMFDEVPAEEPVASTGSKPGSWAR